MNEEENIVSENDLEQGEEVTLFDGKPFSGTCVAYHKNVKKRSASHYNGGK